MYVGHVLEKYINEQKRKKNRLTVAVTCHLLLSIRCINIIIVEKPELGHITILGLVIPNKKY